MRDLLFKNLTSLDGKKKRIASAEIVDQQGVRSVIRRHLVCIVKEINSFPEKVDPEINVIKERNSKELKERFYCRVKGSVHAVSNGKLYEIMYMHSMSINISSSQLTKGVY